MPPAVDRLSVEDLRELFEFLRGKDYRWEPLTPDDLLKQRRASESYSAIHQAFGLGLPPQRASLEAEGLSSTLLDSLLRLPRLPAISRLAQTFVIHDFWPPLAGQEKNHAHFGPESLRLSKSARERIERGGPALKVLDLGCSSGGLLLQWLEYQPQASLVGLDISNSAIELAKTAALAQRISDERARLITAKIDASTRLPEAQDADLVLFNPPMVQPEPGVAWPHRDGGHLGIELPLLFLKFARLHLKEQGQVLCLITNPVVHGRGLFWDELKKLQEWKILDRRLFNPFFNQATARKRHHEDDHIQQIELWGLHLIRN